MMDMRGTYLRVRRAALAAAVVALAVLLAACAPAEDVPPVAVEPLAAEALPEPDPLALLVGRSTLRTWAGDGDARPAEPERAPEVNESASICAGCPILLNDPAAPIHTGGEPYPPGTFPPELAPLWENVTDDLMRPGSHWGDGACADTYTGLGHVRNQWVFYYEEELDDPLTIIVSDLLATGVEFESVTVTTKEYYDQYDPETFINWFGPYDSRFDPVVALSRLGGDVSPGASDSFFNGHEDGEFVSPEGEFYYDEDGHLMQYGPFNVAYQVKVHGLAEGDEELVGSLRHVFGIGFGDPCWVDPSRSGRVLRWLVGGLYTTFGDDVVLKTAPRY